MDLQDIIAALRRPMDYVSKNSFANLDVVRGLEVPILALISQTLSLTLDKETSSLFEKLATNFTDFDSLDTSSKKMRVLDSLRVLECIRDDGRSMPSQETGAGAVDFLKSLEALSTSVQTIKGVGPKLASILKKKGVETVEDALYFLPRTYEDRRNVKLISMLEAGKTETFLGEIREINVNSSRKSRRGIFEMVVGDKSGTITAKWFVYNHNYMRSRFKKGQNVILSGEVKSYHFRKEIHHPDIESATEKDDSLNFNRIVPVYSESEGMYQKNLRKIMKTIVDGYADFLVDPIPSRVRRRQGLMELPKAISGLHFPASEDDSAALMSGRSTAHKSVIFNEFFFLELGLALKKRGVAMEAGIVFEIDGQTRDRLMTCLPFRLTGAQKRVIAEIEDDMKRPHPMNRLIQGDVGSGKTAVALISALIAVENGCQATLMAPTEILAEQHFMNIHPLTDGLGVKTILLTGSVKGTKRDRVLESIREGDADIVIGTHAVIQENVTFKRLGFGIIDEQHRFGVIQRAVLKKKGYNPDILVMTATPIPRTLALTVYGDLDVSVLDELPPGRRPVTTKLYHERDRAEVYEIVEREIKKGGQVYIVYPLIEESEKLDLKDATRMAEHFQREVFPGFRIGLIHGRMDCVDKERMMSAFQAGNLDILVATTVIEVGIDVPNASMMIIEHAERFGLSQLHQLRGRVGRGNRQSRCLLLARYDKSDDAKQRLRVMESTADGFKISEEDLAIRGPGDFLGTRQSGLPEFRVANMVSDVKALQEARREAFNVVEQDPDLTDPSHRYLKEVLRERWKGRLELASVG